MSRAMAKLRENASFVILRMVMVARLGARFIAAWFVTRVDVIRRRALNTKLLLGSHATIPQLPQQVIAEINLGYSGQGGTRTRDPDREAREIRDRYNEGAGGEQHARPSWEDSRAYDRDSKENAACNPGQHAGNADR